MWKYESDGDDNQRTYYVTATNIKGTTLKDTFLRIDCKSKRKALKLCKFLNSLERSGLKYKIESLNKEVFGII